MMGQIMEAKYNTVCVSAGSTAYMCVCVCACVCAGSTCVCAQVVMYECVWCVNCFLKDSQFSLVVKIMGTVRPLAHKFSP